MKHDELKLKDLKQAIYDRFNVNDTKELKKSKQFQVAIESTGKLNLSKKESWKKLYRQCIGKLPETTSSTRQHLNIDNLKQAIYNYFDVKDTKELKKSKRFQMATDGMEKLNLSQKESWKILYRKWIGILPDEQNEEGRGCINGIDIFKYSRPWQVFDLDPKTSSVEDVKRAYRRLSKIYHPDNSKTGDREIFERLEKMYRSLVEGIK